MQFFKNYTQRLQSVLVNKDWSQVEQLAVEIQNVWKENKTIYICGNGGSAANALHITNDLVYGAAGEEETGINVQALAANQSLLTCLANDVGYENIYSYQLKAMGKEGDLLIVLSGSGNSENIINAINIAAEKNIRSCAILGYSGGKALEIADFAIHFDIDDMQIAEDCQLIVGHMLMRWLMEKGKN